MICSKDTDLGLRCRRDAHPAYARLLGLPAGLGLCQQHGEKAVRIRDAEAVRAAQARYQEVLRQAREATVYYVEGHGGFIKIGFSSRLHVRLNRLRLEHGPITLLATHRGGRDAERAMHKLFAGDRVEGEWFVPSPALWAHIERIRSRHQTDDRKSA